MDNLCETRIRLPHSRRPLTTRLSKERRPLKSTGDHAVPTPPPARTPRWNGACWRTNAFSTRRSSVLQEDADILVQLKASFGRGHDLGEYEQDYVSTDHYGDYFIRSVERAIATRDRQADDEFPNGAVAMSLTAAELLAQNRADATTEGRLVLALESIADQLKEVVSLLSVPAREQTSPACQMPQSTDRWENEGGSLKALSSIPPGVVRHTEETFTVGSYRYSNLADAVAEVERSGKRGQS